MTPKNVLKEKDNSSSIESIIPSEEVQTSNPYKLILNLSGNVYRIIKHFRGLSDDIIIDFGEIICPKFLGMVVGVSIS